MTTKNTFREYGIVPMGRMTVTPLKRMLERLKQEENVTVSIYDYIDNISYELVKVNDENISVFLKNLRKEDAKTPEDFFKDISYYELASKWGYISIYKTIKMTIE